MDLFVGVVDLQIGHESKIDWLELNETGHKLLYRDKNATLTLLDTRTGHKEILLNGCSFVQVYILYLLKLHIFIAKNTDSLGTYFFITCCKFF